MPARQWAALLRGINLGPNRRVAMADLRALLGGLGYQEVRTHLQSGNALFTTNGGRPADLEREIEERIRAELALDVKVLIRSAAELAAAVDANPFVGRGVDRAELQFSFLSAAPPAKKVAALDPGRYAPDEFEFGDRVIYVRLPNGIRGSKLPDWEKLLGISVTTRTWNTVTRLRELAGA